MAQQLFFPFVKDIAFRDAAGRVLENVLTQFEDLSEDKLEDLLNTNVEFLVDDQVRNVTGIPFTVDVDSFRYIIGRGKFDKGILSKVCSNMQGKWIISVDEAIVDEESFVGGVAYRHSCAFGYKIPIPKDNPDERILAISSILRLQDEEDFDRKMEFLPYILNMYVAFYTAKILQHWNEPISAVILHGPLVRLISPFSNLLFKKDVIKKVVTADTNPPITTEEIKYIANGALLDSIVKEEEYKNCLSKFVALSSKERQTEIKRRIGEGEIPGICFYFSLLRRLSDLARDMGFHLIGCVENARSTEYSKLYVQYQVERFVQSATAKKDIFRKLLKSYGIRFNQQKIKERFRDLVDKSGWDDEMIHSFSLRFDEDGFVESEYTYPLPIRRYFPGGKNEDIFGFKFGSTFFYEPPAREELVNEIINFLFPFDTYRMLMSFVRTSDLRAPIRVEFLEQGNADDWRRILTSVYVASLPYNSYGLPIFLYYADKIAKMPKEIISTVTKSYLFEQATRALNRLGLSDVHLKDILSLVTQKFRRDFYERG